MHIFKLALLGAYAFLAGSIPTGYLVVRWLKGEDIRARGSGNPGTANVYRCAGAGAGALTLAVDALKGYAPARLAAALYPDAPLVAVAAGAAAVVGHDWTPFLGFKGGKGVATSAGVFLALMPRAMLVAAAAFASATWLSGHISVGSMSAALALPLGAALLGEPRLHVAAAAAAAALILVKHAPNLRRLRQNRELGIHGPSA